MTVVAVLAKAPLAGSAKTRLAAEVGSARALAAYKDVGERVVRQVAKEFSVCVWFDPPDAEDAVRSWLSEAAEFRPQPEGDLGARLTNAFDCHLSEGAGPVVTIGADAPGVTAETVRAAVDALGGGPTVKEQGNRGADVVLGPAVDGGYYLIGLSTPHPELFRAVPWSTADVLRVTLQTCKKWQLRASLLEPLRDLDTGADLAALGLGR